MSAIYRVTVRATAPVADTEVTDRVGDALTNLFPEAELTERPGEIVAESHSMDHFSELLHEQEILDTARREFFGGRTEEGFAFDLKKQAAFQGRVNFAVGNPDELGDVHVAVTVEEPGVEAYVDYVAPPTEEGDPVEPGDVE